MLAPVSRRFRLFARLCVAQMRALSILARPPPSPQLLRTPQKQQSSPFLDRAASRLLRRRVRWPVACAPDDRNTEEATQEDVVTTIDLTLPSASLLEEVAFGLKGEGKIQYVIVTKVAPGGDCDKAGLRPGQKVKKISDPVNNSEMWTLADNASLRFVRDAVRYRRAGTIDLVIQDDGTQLNEEEPLTVGEQLERDWNARQSVDEELTAAQRRIKRRKEYLEESGQRDNGGFFAIVFGLFIVPPLVILLVAYFSGYLDSLYSTVMR